MYYVKHHDLSLGKTETLERHVTREECESDIDRLTQQDHGTDTVLYVSDDSEEDHGESH